MMEWILGWTRWQGRLRRRSLLWRAVVACAVFTVLYVFLERVAGATSTSSNSTFVLYPPFFAVMLSLAVRRLHDQARSPWWLLALLVPVLGPLLVAFLLLFARGTVGDNQYGEDPRTIGRDYLKVAAIEPG